MLSLRVCLSYILSHVPVTHVRMYEKTSKTTFCVYDRNFFDDDNDGFNQGGRTWQAFGGGKNGHETIRQARIYNFRDKCVVFARNLKFSNLTQ